jgi:hypothetical protein
MLTIVDLHQEEELLSSRMGKVAGSVSCSVTAPFVEAATQVVATIMDGLDALGLHSASNALIPVGGAILNTPCTPE